MNPDTAQKIRGHIEHAQNLVRGLTNLLESETPQEFEAGQYIYGWQKDKPVRVIPPCAGMRPGFVRYEYAAGLHGEYPAAECGPWQPTVGERVWHPTHGFGTCKPTGMAGRWIDWDNASTSCPPPIGLRPVAFAPKEEDKPGPTYRYFVEPGHLQQAYVCVGDGPGATRHYIDGDTAHTCLGIDFWQGYPEITEAEALALLDKPGPWAKPQYIKVPPKPPESVPEGYKWTGEHREPRDGENYLLPGGCQLVTCGGGTVSGYPKVYILRKLDPQEALRQRAEAFRKDCDFYAALELDSVDLMVAFAEQQLARKETDT